MALPGVENVGVPRGSIFNLSRGPQLPYIKNPDFGPKKQKIFFICWSGGAQGTVPADGDPWAVAKSPFDQGMGVERAQSATVLNRANLSGN